MASCNLSGKGMLVENIVLSEVSHTQKEMDCVPLNVEGTK